MGTRICLLVPGRRGDVNWSRNGEPSGCISVQCETNSVRLIYRHSRFDDEWQSRDYLVGIEWTPCNYGGQRAWFRCPSKDCGRRVAVLYGGGIFACRYCHQLAYDSQREQPYDRALRRVQDIRERLGGSGSLAEPFPWKPKGMHWRTYNRLRLEAANAESCCWPNWVYRLV
jgi:hypothetical protein